MKKQIARLREPSLQCIGLVYDELQRIVSQVIQSQSCIIQSSTTKQVDGPDLARFSVLRERVVEVVNDLLRKVTRLLSSFCGSQHLLQCREPTMKMVNDLINIELAFLNTSHPDFIGGGGALGQFFDRQLKVACLLRRFFLPCADCFSPGAPVRGVPARSGVEATTATAAATAADAFRRGQGRGRAQQDAGGVKCCESVLSVTANKTHPPRRKPSRACRT
jgi:hypothetical protein